MGYYRRGSRCCQCSCKDTENLANHNQTRDVMPELLVVNAVAKIQKI